MKRSFAVALVAVLSVGLTTFLWWREADSRSRPRQRTAAPEDTKLMALQNQVSSLQRQLDRVAVRQAGDLEERASLSDAATAPGTGPATPQPEPPLVAPPTPEEEAEGFALYFGRLDQRRNAEPHDATWQTQVERRVRDVLTGQLDGSRLETAECGNTLCRLEVRHKDLSAQHVFMQFFHHQLGSFLPEASLYSPPGSSKTDVYVAREGKSLPKP